MRCMQLASYRWMNCSNYPCRFWLDHDLRRAASVRLGGVVILSTAYGRTLRRSLVTMTQHRNLQVVATRHNGLRTVSCYSSPALISMPAMGITRWVFDPPTSTGLWRQKELVDGTLS